MLTVTTASCHTTPPRDASSTAIEPEYARSRLIFRMHMREGDLAGAMPYLANMGRILRSQYSATHQSVES